MMFAFVSIRNGWARDVGVDRRAFCDDSPERVKEREASRATPQMVPSGNPRRPREGGDAEDVTT